jgi:hypothetical protein
MAVVGECWVGCRGSQARARWELGESQVKVKGDDRRRGRSTSFAPALDKRSVAYLFDNKTCWPCYLSVLAENTSVGLIACVS